MIVAPDVECLLPSLLTPEPYLAFARAVAVLHPRPGPRPACTRSAQVDRHRDHGRGRARRRPSPSWGRGCGVGARTVIRPHVALYEDVEVGDDCVLHSGVQVREGCRLGHRVVVHNGAVIGADGFGFAKDPDGRYHKIPQVGIVVIEDDVEIGALTAIDRAALGETRIGRGTKLDNLVQIGHSVTIGEDTVVAAPGRASRAARRSAAGSPWPARSGSSATSTIGDGVIVTAQTGIGHSLPKGAVVSGSPGIENRGWLRSIAVFAKLPELQRRVRELERALAEAKKE